MVHFLRNKDNRTIIECQVSKEDLSSAVDITEYSYMLLSIDDKKNFIMWMTQLAEIRGWWWESEEDSNQWKSIDDFVGNKFKYVASIYDLIYVTD